MRRDETLRAKERDLMAVADYESRAVEKVSLVLEWAGMFVRAGQLERETTETRCMQMKDGLQQREAELCSVKLKQKRAHEAELCSRECAFEDRMKQREREFAENLAMQRSELVQRCVTSEDNALNSFTDGMIAGHDFALCAEPCKASDFGQKAIVRQR